MTDLEAQLDLLATEFTRPTPRTPEVRSFEGAYRQYMVDIAKWRADRIEKVAALRHILTEAQKEGNAAILRHAQERIAPRIITAGEITIAQMQEAASVDEKNGPNSTPEQIKTTKHIAKLLRKAHGEHIRIVEDLHYRLIMLFAEFNPDYEVDKVTLQSAADVFNFFASLNDR